MMEIPPAKDTDAEDVVWGLQTADTLWKRGERIDALVWLRRAAQAAGDANDDDRALELARHAAELTEWMANAEDAAVTKSTAPDVVVQDETSIDVDEVTEAGPRPWMNTAPTAAPPAATAAPPPLPLPLPLPLPPVPVEPQQERPEGTVTIAPQGEDYGRPSAMSVLPAEKVHAGMFDPWADQSSQLAPPNPPPPPPPTRGSVVETEEEEVITSVRPAALSRPGSDLPPVAMPPTPVVAPPRPSGPSVGAPPLPPRPPPPLPSRARPPVPKPAVATVAPPIAASDATPIPDGGVVAKPDVTPPPAAAKVSAPPPAAASVSSKPVASVSLPPKELALGSVPSEPPKPPALEPPAAPPTNVSPVEQSASHEKLVLDDVEAFADLPDDARTAFAAAATLHSLQDGEEIGTFALAYVLQGTFDVAATVVDAPAVRLTQGAVLRARGTTDENVPIRLICAGANGIIATWSDVSVEEAFRTIPWVEEDLRAAADRVQTLVGITIGPLGERLDVSIREEIVGRLTMRPLMAGEVVVNEGEPVPGLLLVGIGELELVTGGKVTGVVSSGDFLFPTEVLGAGSAPSTARAGSGGALVMFGDRRIAQELLVTCPPLLEVFAGM
jgi:hypothetical protein